MLFRFKICPEMIVRVNFGVAGVQIATDLARTGRSEGFRYACGAHRYRVRVDGGKKSSPSRLKERGGEDQL